ncbi:MAG: GvpL/GvpF family gas vesicle protein, partial [Gemmataceae bacterium]|nr:GvpL/GvpF family gas vesicle protein [Gemmataceae bacterium]
MADAGRYLYAVIDAPAPAAFGAVGVDGTAVYTVAEGAVAAVVSDVPNKKMRPERKKVDRKS